MAENVVLPGKLPEEDSIIREDAADAAAGEIRAAHRVGTGGLDFTCEVGRIVLDRCYGGAEATWRSHGSKHASLRRLAERLGGVAHFSAPSLYRCVAIHLVLAGLPAIERLQSLTPSHVRLVLPLGGEDQEALLRETIARRWTVRQLEAAVKFRARRRVGGRPSTPSFVLAIRIIARTSAPDGLAFRDLDRLEAVDPATFEGAFADLMRAREQLDKLQGTLSRRRFELRRPRYRGDPVRRPRGGTDGAP